MMRYYDVTHINVLVPDLREGEAYYGLLFDLDVAWRDAGPAISMFASWEEFDAAGLVPEVTMLWRDNLRIALGAAKPVAGLHRIDHIGLQVSVEQLQAIRGRAGESGLPVVHAREDELFEFRDRYGCQWELDTRSFADPREVARGIEARRRTVAAGSSSS